MHVHVYSCTIYIQFIFCVCAHIYLSYFTDSESPSGQALNTWVKFLGLSQADKHIIKDGKWLTANHMAAVNKLLAIKYPTQNGLQDTCSLGYFKKWLSEPKQLVQVIHVNGNHWACLSNCFCDHNSIDLYDSAQEIPDRKGSIAQQASAIMKLALPELTINVINVQLQEGSDDCGLFAIAMAYDICREVDPFTRTYTQEEMRSHLLSCFDKQSLQMFPSRNRILFDDIRIVKKVVVELHCLCRQPDIGDMACCDSCDNWYHKGCVPIPDDVFEDEDDLVEFLCCQCELILNSLLCALCHNF